MYNRSVSLHNEIVMTSECQKFYEHAVYGDTKYTFYTFMKFRCSKNQGEIIRLAILFLQYYIHMVDLEDWRFNYDFFTSLFQIRFNLNFFIVCKAIYIL